MTTALSLRAARPLSASVVCLLVGAVLGGCRQPYPKAFKGPLATVADSVFRDRPPLDCLNRFNSGPAVACRAAVADTEIFSYVDTAKRITVVGHVFHQQREAANASWERLVRENKARYGPGVRCTVHGIVRNDMRWAFGDRTLITRISRVAVQGPLMHSLRRVGFAEPIRTLDTSFAAVRRMCLQANPRSCPPRYHG
jgi:hypothetical protein